MPTPSRSDLLDSVAELTALHAPAGREDAVIRYLHQRLAPLSDRLELDPFGNLYAFRHGPEEGRRLVITAHADEIGLIVRSIDDRGFVRFAPVGSPHPQLLPGRRVRVGDHEGVIGVKSDHRLTEKEREERTVPHYSDLYIDLGVDRAEDVAELGIHPGTQITFVGELHRLGSNRAENDGTDRFAGKSVDNRLSCALLLHLFRSLEGRELPVTVVGMVTVQEEVGMRGAGVATHRLEPELVLTLDVTVCDDTPEHDRPGVGRLRLGRGPVLHWMEQSSVSHRGMLAHPRVLEALVRVAEREDIPYQRGLLMGGLTDASKIHRTGRGAAACYLGLPCRYVHSTVEVFDLGDAVHTAKLVEGFVFQEAAEVDLNRIRI